jgi:ribosomal RNA-processing protein 9
MTVESNDNTQKKAMIADAAGIDTQGLAKGHTNTITSCALSFDNKMVASASKDGSVIQWDVETQGKILKLKPQDTNKSIRGVTFCGDSFGGSMIVSCGEDRLVRLWDIRTPGECVRELKGHQGDVNGVKFAYDESTNAGKLFTIGSDKALKVWYTDGSDGKMFESYFGHTSSVLCMDMMSINRPITGGDDHSLRAWNCIRDSHSIFSSGGHSAPIDSVFVLDQNHYISGGQDGSMCLWGSTSRKSLCRVEEAHDNSSWVTAVSGVRNSDLVLSGSSDGCIRFWRVGRPTSDVSKKTKMVIDEVDTTIDVKGIVHDIQVSGNLVVAAVGRDHKHGRWITDNKAHNGLLFARLNFE